jgi:hypothetical protein
MSDLRTRFELHDGDALLASDRDRLAVISGNPFEIPGVVTYLPGAGLGLASHACDELDVARAFEPGEDALAWFDPFVAQAGFGAAVAATRIRNGRPARVHHDGWGVGSIGEHWTATYCYRWGSFTGMEHALIDYRVAFDLQHGDLLLTRTDVRHANLPVDGELDRLAVILCLEDRR